MSVYMILAKDSKNGIGKDGTLPWRLKLDMKFFKDITSTKDLNKVEREFGLNTDDQLKTEETSTVIMGRKTYESIPQKFRPLPNRVNVILTRNEKYSDALSYTSIDELKRYIEQTKGNVFIIGGAEIYKQFMHSSECTRIYLTEIENDCGCDTFIDEISEDFKEIAASGYIEEGEIKYRFKVLKNNYCFR